MRARRRGRLKQRRTLPLLSFVSKQMSARLFSLLQYKGLLTKKKKHAWACAHFFLGKSMHSGSCNFPRCFAVPPSSEQGDKGCQGDEKLLLSALRFMAHVCFHFFLCFIISSNWLVFALCSRAEENYSVSEICSSHSVLSFLNILMTWIWDLWIYLFILSL